VRSLVPYQLVATTLKEHKFHLTKYTISFVFCPPRKVTCRHGKWRCGPLDDHYGLRTAAITVFVIIPVDTWMVLNMLNHLNETSCEVFVWARSNLLKNHTSSPCFSPANTPHLEKFVNLKNHKRSIKPLRLNMWRRLQTCAQAIFKQVFFAVHLKPLPLCVDCHEVAEFS